MSTNGKDPAAVSMASELAKLLGNAQPPAADPLLSAIIAKLPAASHPFPPAQRQAWLTLMSMGLDLVYGSTSERSMKPQRTVPPAALRPAAKAGAQSRPKRGKLSPAGPRFYIDRDHRAKNWKGEPINPDDVMDHLVDLRGEKGDLAKIVWADGSTGIPRGKQINITLG
jgi:hypothetical protein